MNRHLVRARANGKCEYCRETELYSFASFHVDHIIAQQHGGDDDAENLAFACPECNWHKGTNLTAIDPVSKAVTRLFHPRLDRWEEHFALEGFLVVGRTDVGRATIRLLNLNSPDHVEARRLA